MKVFLVWSGARSFEIAKALNGWLNRVIQAATPFFSHEIEKGAKWSGEIEAALEGTNFGIVCLTPDNLDSTWIHYESGALSKTKEAVIWTYLTDLRTGDVPQPLGKFQHTQATKDDTLKLLRSMNKRLADVGGEPLSDAVLEENFEMFWPKLELALKAATPLAQTKSQAAQRKHRDDDAKLDEILELLRNQERRRPKEVFTESTAEHQFIDYMLSPRTDLASDRAILKLLRQNPDWELKRIAKEFGVSPITAVLRLLELQNKGLIKISKGKCELTEEGTNFLDSDDEI